MMKVYKLTYQNKEQAVADLLAKGIYVQTDEDLAFGEGVASVVEIGLIVLTPAVLEEMEVIEEPIYADGYHYDILTENEYDFGANLIVPKNPKHAFAGYPITEEHEPINDSDTTAV